MPTEYASVLVAPNFYLEVKGPDGNAAVAQRQACYDGTKGLERCTPYRTSTKPRPAMTAMPTPTARPTTQALASYSYILIT